MSLTFNNIGIKTSANGLLQSPSLKNSITTSENSINPLFASVESKVLKIHSFHPKMDDILVIAQSLTNGHIIDDENAFEKLINAFFSKFLENQHAHVELFETYISKFKDESEKEIFFLNFLGIVGKISNSQLQGKITSILAQTWAKKQPFQLKFIVSLLNAIPKNLNQYLLIYKGILFNEYLKESSFVKIFKNTSLNFFSFIIPCREKEFHIFSFENPINIAFNFINETQHLIGHLNAGKIIATQKIHRDIGCSLYLFSKDNLKTYAKNIINLFFNSKFDFLTSSVKKPSELISKLQNSFLENEQNYLVEWQINSLLKEAEKIKHQEEIDILRCLSNFIKKVETNPIAFIDKINFCIDKLDKKSYLIATDAFNLILNVILVKALNDLKNNFDIQTIKNFQNILINFFDKNILKLGQREYLTKAYITLVQKLYSKNPLEIGFFIIKTKQQIKNYVLSNDFDTDLENIEKDIVNKIVTALQKSSKSLKASNKTLQILNKISEIYSCFNAHVDEIKEIFFSELDAAINEKNISSLKVGIKILIIFLNNNLEKQYINKIPSILKNIFSVLSENSNALSNFPMKEFLGIFLSIDKIANEKATTIYFGLAVILEQPLNNEIKQKLYQELIEIYEGHFEIPLKIKNFNIGKQQHSEYLKNFLVLLSKINFDVASTIFWSNSYSDQLNPQDKVYVTCLFSNYYSKVHEKYSVAKAYNLWLKIENQFLGKNWPEYLLSSLNLVIAFDQIDDNDKASTVDRIGRKILVLIKENHAQLSQQSWDKALLGQKFVKLKEVLDKHSTSIDISNDITSLINNSDLAISKHYDELNFKKLSCFLKCEDYPTEAQISDFSYHFLRFRTFDTRYQEAIDLSLKLITKWLNYNSKDAIESALRLSLEFLEINYFQNIWNEEFQSLFLKLTLLDKKFLETFKLENFWVKLTSQVVRSGLIVSICNDCNSRWQVIKQLFYMNHDILQTVLKSTKPSGWPSNEEFYKFMADVSKEPQGTELVLQIFRDGDRRDIKMFKVILNNLVTNKTPVLYQEIQVDLKSNFLSQGSFDDNDRVEIVSDLLDIALQTFESSINSKGQKSALNLISCIENCIPKLPVKNLNIYLSLGRILEHKEFKGIIRKLFTATERQDFALLHILLNDFSAKKTTHILELVIEQVEAGILIDKSHSSGFNYNRTEKLLNFVLAILEKDKAVDEAAMKDVSEKGGGFAEQLMKRLVSEKSKEVDRALVDRLIAAMHDPLVSFISQTEEGKIISEIMCCKDGYTLLVKIVYDAFKAKPENNSVLIKNVLLSINLEKLPELENDVEDLLDKIDSGNALEIYTLLIDSELFIPNNSSDSNLKRLGIMKKIEKKLIDLKHPINPETLCTLKVTKLTLQLFSNAANFIEACGSLPIPSAPTNIIDCQIHFLLESYLKLQKIDKNNLGFRFAHLTSAFEALLKKSSWGFHRIAIFKLIAKFENFTEILIDILIKCCPNDRVLLLYVELFKFAAENANDHLLIILDRSVKKVDNTKAKEEKIQKCLHQYINLFIDTFFKDLKLLMDPANTEALRQMVLKTKEVCGLLAHYLPFQTRNVVIDLFDGYMNSSTNVIQAYNQLIDEVDRINLLFLPKSEHSIHPPGTEKNSEDEVFAITQRLRMETRAITCMFNNPETIQSDMMLRMVKIFSVPAHQYATVDKTLLQELLYPIAMLRDFGLRIFYETGKIQFLEELFHSTVAFLKTHLQSNPKRFNEVISGFSLDFSLVLMRLQFCISSMNSSTILRDHLSTMFRDPDPKFLNNTYTRIYSITRNFESHNFARTRKDEILKQLIKFTFACFQKGDMAKELQGLRFGQADIQDYLISIKEFLVKDKIDRKYVDRFVENLTAMCLSIFDVIDIDDTLFSFAKSEKIPAKNEKMKVLINSMDVITAGKNIKNLEKFEMNNIGDPTTNVIANYTNSQIRFTSGGLMILDGHPIIGGTDGYLAIYNVFVLAAALDEDKIIIATADMKTGTPNDQISIISKSKRTSKFISLPDVINQFLTMVQKK